MKLAPVMNLVSDVGRFFKQGIHYQGFVGFSDAVESGVVEESSCRCRRHG